MFHLYPSAVLAVMFGYQPPNDETTPRYRAVGEARDRFESAITDVFTDLRDVPQDAAGFVALHARVSMAALDYASAINAVAPVGDHVMRLSLQAIDSVTLARMWANKAIRAAEGPVRGRLVSLAMTESEKAQLCANAGIALDAPVSAAYAASLES
jgi:hypothetical protein